MTVDADAPGLPGHERTGVGDVGTPPVGSDRDSLRPWPHGDGRQGLVSGEIDRGDGVPERSGGSRIGDVGGRAVGSDRDASGSRS